MLLNIVMCLGGELVGRGMGSIASKAFRRASSITVIIDVFRARASKRWRRGASKDFVKGS